MKRTTGTHRVTTAGGEKVRAFIPHPLPPQRPPLQLTKDLQRMLAAARRIHELLGRDRQVVINHKATTIPAVRLFDLLPEHPMVTLARTQELLETTKPTATKAIKALCDAGVLHEITGKQRDRIYAYQGYLSVLAEDTELPSRPPGSLGAG